MFAPKNFTASATLARTDADTILSVNAAAGLTLTLPAATGTGDKYFIFVGTTVTSNSVVVKVANSTDIMSGLALAAADAGATVNAWETGASDDTITFNGTTTGGVKGDYIELIDVASGIWVTQVRGSATGTEATCFSATV
jgi:hypothetical protein